MEIKETLGEIHYSKRRRIMVNISMISKELKLDVRMFYYTIDKQWIPTQKGICVPLEITPKLIELLTKVTKHKLFGEIELHKNRKIKKKIRKGLQEAAEGKIEKLEIKEDLA